MFRYLKGTVAELGSNIVVIDVSGVGFLCSTSLYTIAQLKVGETAKLYTHLNVREDALEIFAFFSLEELDSFKLLTSISGVGPRAAISILSSVTPNQLASAVAAGDEKPILAANGIGKKLAGRIMLELKDKINHSDIILPEKDGQGYTSQPNGNDSEAFAALSSLGYSRDEINSALRGADISGMSVEDIIKTALARLMR